MGIASLGFRVHKRQSAACLAATVTSGSAGTRRIASGEIAKRDPRLRVAARSAILGGMMTVVEIETAIEQLPASQLAELATWLEQLRVRRAAQSHAEAWLERARGAARTGVTTAEVMALTRGE